MLTLLPLYRKENESIVKYLAQGHPLSKWQSQNSSLGNTTQADSPHHSHAADFSAQSCCSDSWVYEPMASSQCAINTYQGIWTFWLTCKMYFSYHHSDPQWCVRWGWASHGHRRWEQNLVQRKRLTVGWAGPPGGSRFDWSINLVR